GRADLKVVGTAKDIIQALEFLKCSEVDALLLDVAPADATARIRAFRLVAPDLKIVLLALDDSQEDKLLACIQAGASGFVPLGGSLEDLATTVQSAARGEMTCPPRITGQMATLLMNSPAAIVIGPRLLTRREREVAQLIDRGLSNKEIAGALHL